MVKIADIKRIGENDLSCLHSSFRFASTFSVKDEFQGLKSGVYWIGGISLRKRFYCFASLDCSSCTIKYGCTFSYFMNDAFSDPYDVFNLLPGDVNTGGTPFHVIQDWHRSFKGEFSK